MMVDRTTYSDEARTPKIALRQIFGRLGLRQELCKLAADSGLLSIEVVAMLGDTAAAVKATLKTLVDPAALGADEAARELSLMQIAAVWHACHALQTQFATRRAKMEEDPSKVPEMAQEDHAEFRGRFVRNHPDVVLLDAKEPHKKFVEKLSRDFLVHGMVPFYSASEIRTRSDTISQKTGLTRTAEDLMAADSLIRKKIYRLQSEQRETYGSFQEALLEVINNHKYLWNDARTKAVLAKVERKDHDPVREPDQVQMSDSPAKSPNKNKKKRARNKELLKEAKQLKKG